MHIGGDMAKQVKKKMGRPRKPDAKTTLIALKVSKRELAALRKAAKEAGISMSAYIMAPHRE